MNDEEIIWHQTGIDADGKAFVLFILGDGIIVRMSCEQARKHAKAIAEAAEESEQDALLVSFARNKLNYSAEEACGLLVEFRRYRRQAGSKRQGLVEGEGAAS